MTEVSINDGINLVWQCNVSYSKPNTTPFMKIFKELSVEDATILLERVGNEAIGNDHITGWKNGYKLFADCLRARPDLKLVGDAKIAHYYLRTDERLKKFA